ncbi:uncharacterized protein [Dermacentor albipictus]|uniref:uncharacterized protein isoform X1 n=1 Tax=Dermacentor albipictus TaxID=60249 RepID=UPI0031FC8BCD
MTSNKRPKAHPTEDYSKDQAKREIPILLPQDERHRTYKVAVAMAMIRSKPDNVSADDYVRKLAEDLRNSEARLSDVCKSLEDDVIHLRQKIALMSVRGGIRSEPLAFRRESWKNSTEKLSITAERIGQHWVFLENYLSVASNAALFDQGGVTDVEELTLRSANNLLRTLRKSAPIGFVEMELSNKALSTLADMCDDRRSAVAPSLRAAVVGFVTDSVNEIVEQDAIDYRRLENIASWVGSLASGQAFTLAITRHLLDKLLQFASFIGTLQEDQQGPEAEHFDRSFFLLQCTENAVASLKQVSPLDCCELSETAKALADFSFKCQETQPLFAGYLYEVVRGLKKSLTSRETNKQRVKKIVPLVRNRIVLDNTAVDTCVTLCNLKMP